MGSEVYTVCHHPRDVYVIGTGQPEDFTLPEDTYHYEWAKEGTFEPIMTNVKRLQLL
jgi:cleavage and polyadenylation specificity factor subunit 1